MWVYTRKDKKASADGRDPETLVTKNCRNMSLDESIEKLEYSYAFFQANRLSRYMLTGKKSMGPVGFVADQTVPCLLTNVKSLKTVRETIDRMGDKLKNRKKIMPYAILNESHVVQFPFIL